MKVWNAYGSEHSSRIVLIGRFKDETGRQRFLKDFNFIADCVAKMDNVYDMDVETFPRERHDALMGGKVCGGQILTPDDCKGFAFERPEADGELGVKIESNEYDWNGVIKLLVENGAKVEVFSEHSYPQEP